MRPNRHTTIIRIGLSLLLPAFAAIAHEGFGEDHVTGTIAKVTGNVVTVKTTAGNVDVKLDSKTEITRNAQESSELPILRSVREVSIVDVPEGSKDKVAHSVKLGVTSARAKPAH